MRKEAICANVTKFFRRAALVLVWSAAVLRADDFTTLINEWAGYVTGGTNINLSDPYISSYVSGVGNAANSYWSSMNVSSGRSYLWSDAASTTDSADVTTCYNRLAAMAKGYATIGSPLYGNTNLAAAILSGLDWMYTNRYYPGQTQYGNWWDWQIGAPLSLNQAMVLMYPLLSGTQITNYCNAIDNFTPGVSLTGANRVWTAEVVGVRGAVGRNAAKVAAARDGLSDVSDGGAGSIFKYVTSSDGFYKDGSFIQHGTQPYSAGYGAWLFEVVVQMMAWLAPTEWHVTDPQSTNVVQWCYHNFQPLIYYGAMPGHVMGRDISRYNDGNFDEGQGVINAILRLAQSAPASDAANMNSMVKYWAQVDPTATLPSYVSIDLLGSAEALLTNNTIVPRGELVGHYAFPSMNRDMHLRPGFGFTLSMFSTRTANYECINDENWHGWFTAYGMGYLFLTNDLTQFDDSYWPTVDPYHLPGTTVVLTPLANGASAGAASSQHWVGGAVLSNSVGSAGMSLADVNSSLVAKKSWFMYDNEVVCLGAGISCSSSTNVQTTVEDRNLHSSSGNVFTVNGATMPAALGWSSNLNNVSWCALDVSGGYYFPGGANIIAARTARTGAWTNINNLFVPATSAPITRNYLSLILDHGAAPSNAAYSYVLLPNYSASAVSNYAAAPPIVILTNSPVVQAARKITQGVTSANFWGSGTNTVDFITCNGQAAVITRETNGVLELAVSDPTWTNNSTIALTLNRSATALISADVGITVLQLSPQVVVAVAVSGARGQTFQAKFSELPVITAVPDFAATGGNTPLPINVLANDSSIAGTLTLTGVSAPAHGAALVTNQLVWYSPAVNFSGTDTFNYFLTAGTHTATGAVSVAVGGPTLAVAPAQVSASSAQAGNPATNVVDGDLNTRWSAQNVGTTNQWIQFDLLSTQLVRGVNLAFYAGNSRVDYFTVQLSGDGSNWIAPLTNAASSGDSTNLESFYFPPAWARYVMVMGQGNSQGTGWNSYTEIGVLAGTNSAPVAVGDVVGTAVSAQVTVNVLTNDFDLDDGPQSLSLVSFTQPAHGEVGNVGGNLRYQPNFGYVGADNFDYAISDGFFVVTGFVSIVITNLPGLPPVLSPFANFSIIGGTNLSVASQAVDPNSPPQRLLFSLLNAPAGAGINVTSGVISWRPTVAQSGTSNLFTIVTTQNGWLNSFAPVADAYVRDGSYASTNFGTDTNLAVKFSTTVGSSRESFLQFNLTNLPGALGSAILQLAPSYASFAGVQAVAEVTNNGWTETTLTWNNKPASGPAVATWTPQAGVAVSVTVATAVNDALTSADGLLSLRMSGTNSTADGLVYYGSSRGAAAWVPRLNVVSSTGLALSSTQSFWVGVVAPQPPRIAPPVWDAGALGLTIFGDAGPDYTIQGATNLAPAAWQTLYFSNAPPLPMQWWDTNQPRAKYFYRVLLGP